MNQFHIDREEFHHWCVAKLHTQMPECPVAAFVQQKYRDVIITDTGQIKLAMDTVFNLPYWASTIAHVVANGQASTMKHVLTFLDAIP